MELLRIETGEKEYSLNECCTVRFNPTDSAFVEKLYNAFSELDARQDAWQKEAAEVKDNREVFRLARRRDAEMRDVINGVFAVDVCTPVFGGINVYALAGGLPLWANLLLAVMDTIDSAFSKEKADSNPRIAKYLNKYRT